MATIATHEQISASVISGGLNGGATSEDLTPEYLVMIVFSVVDTIQGADIILKALICLETSATIGAWILFAVGILVTLLAMFDYGTCIKTMTAYLEGDAKAGEDLLLMFWLNVIFKFVADVLHWFAIKFAEELVAKHIAETFGPDFLNKMLLKMDDVFEIRDYITLLKKANITDDVSKTFMEKYGKEGFDWFKRMKKHGISDTLLKKLLQVDDISLLTDDVMKVIMNSDGHVDDIIEILNKYGDDAAKYIVKYGDEAAEVIKDYGDEAIEALKDGKTPGEIFDEYKGKLRNGYIFGEPLANSSEIQEIALRAAGEKAEVVAKLDSSQFRNINDVDSFLDNMPKDAARSPWNPTVAIPDGVDRFIWTDEMGNKWFAECHGPDSSAMVGSNAQTGWVYRISVKINGSGKAFYMATDGKFYSEKMFNANSEYYINSIVNDTHIPIFGGE